MKPDQSLILPYLRGIKKIISYQCLSVLLISLLTLGILGVGVRPCSAGDSTLNNAEVISLQGLDIGDDAIIQKIKISKCDFDTSLEGLRKLKEAKVSNPVIAAMIAAKPSASDATATVAVDPNDPAAPHSAGVWVLQGINGQKKMIQLESEPAVESSSGGYIGPYGIGKVAQTVRLNGTRSDLQLSESRPVFYFYLGNSKRADGAHEFSSARSAKDFTLAQFTITKDKDRALEVGREGGYGGSSGVDRKALKEFSSEKIADGIYKIVPKDDLYIGEYSFCRAITRGQGEFFPFGINSASSSANSTVNTRDSDIARFSAALNAGRPEDVIQALKALKDMNAREAVPAILPLLKNPDGHVVSEACRTLAVLGSKDSIPTIEPLVNGPLDFLKTEGSALSIAATVRRNKLEKEIKKEAQDAIAALQAKP